VIFGILDQVRGEARSHQDKAGSRVLDQKRRHLDGDALERSTANERSRRLDGPGGREHVQAQPVRGSTATGPVGEIRRDVRHPAGPAPTTGGQDERHERHESEGDACR
jgi:hypothetical protein